MLRSELITAVKARLDEFSPFEEPVSLVAIPTSDVKPIQAIIDTTLPTAADTVLMQVPLSIVRSTTNNITLAANGTPQFGGSPVLTRMTDDPEVGLLRIPEDYLRLHTVRFAHWRRDVHRAITPDSSDYLLQRNPHTRGRAERPYVALNEGFFEIYSLPVDRTSECRTFTYIPRTSATCPSFEDSVAPLIILETAKNIFETYNNLNAAKTLIEEQQRLLQAAMVNP